MTIASVTSKVIYVGTGSTAAAARVFAYPFKVLRAADLIVTDYNINTSVGSVMVLDTDYEVSGVGGDSGGNVTITGSYTSLATSSWLVIQREVDLTQETDYVENDAFGAETHENALDKLCMADQQLQEQVDRCIKADVSQTSSNVNYVDFATQANYASSSATVAVTQASNAAVYAAQASASANTLADPTGQTVGYVAVVNATQDGWDFTGMTTASPIKTVILKVFSDSEYLSTGNGAMYLTIPDSLNTKSITSVAAHIYTVSSSGKPSFDLYNATQSMGILSTKVYIDENEKDSSTCSTASVVSTTSASVTSVDELRIDVDDAGTGSQGLEVRIVFS